MQISISLNGIECGQGEFSDKEQFIANVKDTIERLKIGQQLLQDWLDGKTDTVYYRDLEKLPVE